MGHVKAAICKVCGGQVFRKARCRKCCKKPNAEQWQKRSRMSKDKYLEAKNEARKRSRTSQDALIQRRPSLPPTTDERSLSTRSEAQKVAFGGPLEPARTYKRTPPPAYQNPKDPAPTRKLTPEEQKAFDARDAKIAAKLLKKARKARIALNPSANDSPRDIKRSGWQPPETAETIQRRFA